MLCIFHILDFYHVFQNQKRYQYKKYLVWHSTIKSIVNVLKYFPLSNDASVLIITKIKQLFPLLC